VPPAAYIGDWLSLLLRWAHIITSIAWIGASFYFIWLDARLNVPPRNPEHESVGGDLWAVHGGGFYHSQKYRVAPPELPEPLHWFKWEAYFTWMTGFALFVVVYYLNADAYLVDARVMDLRAGAAVAISVGLILGGVVVYEALCRTISAEVAFTVTGAVVVLATCWSLTQIFSGRGAFMQIGAMLGTIMAANVAHVIIPSQRRLVEAKREGKTLDPAPGLEAKRRSVHNNYMTLPVVFAMISPHFAFTYAHAWNWAILFAIFVAGALIRQWFNLRNRGRNVLAVPALALAILGAVAIAVAPSPRPAAGVPSGLISPASGPTPSAPPAATFTQVRSVVQQRCAPCHSASPTHPTTSVAAAGVAFDSPREIEAWAPRIYERAVVTRTMPLGNATAMTDAEREVIGAWFASGAPVE
jgi:uncharacterized membrane protein